MSYFNEATTKKLLMSKKEKAKAEADKKLNYVISGCKSCVKFLKSKYEDEFDFKVKFQFDMDDYDSYLYGTMKYVGVGKGNVINEGEDPNEVDNDTIATRKDMVRKLIRLVNREIAKNKDIGGYLDDEWSKYEFTINYNFR